MKLPPFVGLQLPFLGFCSTEHCACLASSPSHLARCWMTVAVSGCLCKVCGLWGRTGVLSSSGEPARRRTATPTCSLPHSVLQGAGKPRWWKCSSASALFSPLSLCRGHPEKQEAQSGQCGLALWPSGPGGILQK